MKRLKLLSIIFAASTLLISCKKEETPLPETSTKPTVDFSYIGASKPAPANVFFTNTSTNATSFLWDFGDNGTSTEENPQHVYKSGGVYTVKLTATGNGGSESSTKTINIGSAPTKAKILSVTISNIPFVQTSGTSWDGSNGPDVYFTIENNNFLELAKSSIQTDVTPSSLPLSWNFTTPFEITDFENSFFVIAYDSDAPDADEYLGLVSFLLSLYTTGSNSYPTTITQTYNGLTVTLTLKWE